jgi:predicted ribonuclease YlaK
MGKDIGALPGDKSEKLLPWMQRTFISFSFCLILLNITFAFHSFQIENVFIFVNKY